MEFSDFISDITANEAGTEITLTLTDNVYENGVIFVQKGVSLVSVTGLKDDGTAITSSDYTFDANFGLIIDADITSATVVIAVSSCPGVIRYNDNYFVTNKNGALYNSARICGCGSIPVTTPGFENYITDISVDETERVYTLTFANNAIFTNDMLFFGNSAFVKHISGHDDSGNELQIDNDTDITIAQGMVIFTDDIADGTITIAAHECITNVGFYNNNDDEFYVGEIVCGCDATSDAEPCYNNPNDFSCSYTNLGRQYNKKISGLLTNERYLLKHPKYALNFTYDNSTKTISIDDSNLTYATQESVINPSLYSKFLLLTYLSFDRDTGKFAEQIIYSSGINKDSSWEHEIVATNQWSCWYHNSECVEIEDDFTNVTVFVEYIGDDNTYLSTTKTYPALYTNRLNEEGDTRYVDGIYKTYYLMVRDVLATNTGTFLLYKDNVIRLNMLGVDWVLRANDNYELVTTSSSITVNTIGTSNSITFDSTTIADITDYFTMVEGTVEGELTYQPIEMLRSIPSLLCGDIQSSNILQEIMAEEVHILTYELADDIIDSIEDCSLPCERFSFDEWLGLRQKHMSANTNFCQGNIMKAALDIYTARKRCKNC